MRIELLFPEVCNLYGDMGNINYLKKCFKNEEVIETKLSEKPRFLDEDIDFVYMAGTTEKTQERIIELLAPYKKEFENAIDSGKVFLFTGNALEILGDYIEKPNGDKVHGLGIVSMYAKQNFNQRHYSECEVKYMGKSVIGFKTQFTTCFPKDDSFSLFELSKGMGMNPECNFEGVHKNNLYATYLTGPLLILNPYFTKHLLDVIGVKNCELPFEKELISAYEKKLEEFDKYISTKPQKYKAM